MLTPYDDFPIHQTADPITQPSSGDPNHYDRYFFNGHEHSGELFFAAAMGHYPNRDVADAAFSVVHGGVQRSVFASGRMPLDRSTAVGPIRVEVLEPLRTLRLVVTANDTGISADLTYRARTVAVEEPRQRVVRDGRLMMDYTRLTQWGTWEGTITVDGTTRTVRHTGTRDRSWGVRPVGAQAPTNVASAAPQLFWLWAPLHFDDVCTHLALFERADGERWMHTALVVPVLGDGQPTWGPAAAPAEECGPVAYDLDWKPGTRQIEHASLKVPRVGGELDIVLEPLCTFRMRGIGYLHPHWGHGSAHGGLEVGGETLQLDTLDPQEPANIHVQTVCAATMGERRGIGILEQLAIGEHRPSGLSGLFTGWQP